MAMNRRDWMKYGFASAGLWGGSCLAGASVRAATLIDRRGLRIKRIERTTVRVPFRDAPSRAMDREIPHWRYAEICDVQLENGVHGYGETLLYYTWGATSDFDVERATGKHAAELMWEDGNGAGLQMALFDAVARSSDVPIHSLLGEQAHKQTPLSWWNIDMPPEDMAAECALAHQTGYMSYKTKGRPWFDLWNQMDAATKVVPPEFKIDMDFNETLLDAERAEPILKRLATYPQIDIYESPIPQHDLNGNAKLCEASDILIAMHFGRPDPKDTVRHRACDAFVITHGARGLLQQGYFSAMAEMPFWLQLVGTGITAAWSLHFGAVLSHATLPAVNCHQLYVHSLLKRPIEVKDGSALIPEGPGMGHEIDWDAVERYRVPKPESRPIPQRIMETTWDNGRKMYISNNDDINFMIKYALQEKIPFYEPGAMTRLYPDDGSPAWRTLYNRARTAPVFIDP